MPVMLAMSSKRGWSHFLPVPNHYRPGCICPQCEIDYGGVCIHICMCIYSKATLNRLTMGQTLNGPFREVVSLGS